ncbi:MAG: bifunctional diaminohydroxyphosphoribosylaminopyrimidine deaminase/5-amino-6-(5-phosphoribosylamino)uracil reductase RibD [Vicinamibacterales bacterium]
MGDDARWMRRALLHARRGLGRTTPNPVVGACIVTAEGVVVADGTHERAGAAHAEINALTRAGEQARGATMYCTLEPCAHVGRTGPCADRIIAAGIRRVVAAMEDPFELVSGRGFAALRDGGVEVVVGVERAAATRLNLPFMTSVLKERPFVILKAATTLDGRITAARGRRTPLTSVPALRHAHYVRAQVDAIAVGSETVLVDDPLLTAREVYRERPLTRVIFDRRLRTAPSARLLSTLATGPVIIVTSPEAARAQGGRRSALEHAGATILLVGERSIGSALRKLVGFGIQSVVLEGGAGVHGAAWDEGVVDAVHLYVAPLTAGPAGVPFLEGRSFSTSALADLSVTPLGPDVLFEGYVHGPH